MEPWGHGLGTQPGSQLGCFGGHSCGALGMELWGHSLGTQLPLAEQPGPGGSEKAGGRCGRAGFGAEGESAGLDPKHPGAAIPGFPAVSLASLPTLGSKQQLRDQLC